MDSGLYERFLSMHWDQMDNMEAHNTCVFIYWHRQFLVGFENMLRSLAPAYACVTIPYYDYVNDNTKYMTNACSTLDTCSDILRELGSVASGAQKTLTFGGHSISGRCDATFPLNHFNQYEQGVGAQCVPRGAYTTSYFPAAVGFTGIKDSILGNKDVSTVNSDIEDGPHNYMHNTLGGAMQNPFLSPADPIFYSHHAMVDALNAIYYKCRVAPLGFTDAQKQSNSLSFQGCTVNGAPINAASSILMRAVVGGQRIDVHQEATTKAFFAGVPTQYYKLTDNTDLGDNSYSYEFSGLIADLYTNCGSAGLSTASNLRALKQSDAPNTPRDARGRLQNYVKCDSKAHVKKYEGWRRALTKLAKAQGLSAAETETEIYKIVVSYYNNCLPGGIQDLSPDFKALWRITHEPKQVMIRDKLLDGSDPIKLVGWEDVNADRLGCRGDSKTHY
ncbi:hypothetical protein ACHHYP_17472 [Achlya hypogyna]|uniref:Tyrosinase copper-binding domain-containing protein n=1 Tax=Achlya hypogyna TaxID=1202772 RepID=A0A1V9Y4B3_ACHHY|nr:hypothetical protein ACHHYP_17472 [Achlya hypogyna]